MRCFLVIISFIFFTSCSTSKQSKYSFFVAGHTYGNPLNSGKEKGLYKPFKDKTGFLNQEENMAFGALLGDIVWIPDYWPEALLDVSKFKMPIKIIRGTHEGSLKNFEKKFGESYKSFTQNKDLFIVLDPNIDNWNISGEQLDFLKKTLLTEGVKARNIFVFTHQLLWWSKEKLIKPRPNSVEGRAKKTNFWSEVAPLFKQTNKEIIFFAGDVGAFSKERRKRKHIIEYCYLKEDNLTFIATGMGGGVRDNFVITDVASDGAVSFRLIHLNGNAINSLGKLEDYNNSN